MIFSSGLSDSTLAIARPGAGAAHLRDVVDLEPVELAAVGEAQQIGVRRGDEEVLDEIVFARRAAGDALAAAMLGAIGVQRQPLDVAVVADRDRVDLLGDQVFDSRLRPPRVDDLRPPLVAVLVAQLDQVAADDGEDVRARWPAALRSCGSARAARCIP